MEVGVGRKERYHIITAMVSTETTIKLSDTRCDGTCLEGNSNPASLFDALRTTVTNFTDPSTV